MLEDNAIELISIDAIDVQRCSTCGAFLTEEGEVIGGCLYDCDRPQADLDIGTHELNFED